MYGACEGKIYFPGHFHVTALGIFKGVRSLGLLLCILVDNFTQPMLFWEKLLSFILLIYWHIKKQGLCIPFIYGWTVLHN